jgi:hypothetical protein
MLDVLNTHRGTNQECGWEMLLQISGEKKYIITNKRQQTTLVRFSHLVIMLPNMLADKITNIKLLTNHLHQFINLPNICLHLVVG